jgi:acyl-CoA thioester hydrolase
MYQHEIKIRVRYGETDQMGYVYYGNYAMYYEVARVESLRNLGFAYKDLEAGGVMLPVLENHSYFIAAAKYDDLLTIKVTVPEKPGVKIGFRYEIINENDILINKGNTILAFVNMETGKPCKPPEVMRKLLNPYFT